MASSSDSSGIAKSSQAVDSGGGEGAEKKVPTSTGRRAAKKRVVKRRRRCRSYARPAYRQMVRRWQRPAKIAKPRYREGLRDLVIYSVNLGERIRVFPYLADGTLDPEAMADFEHLFRDKSTHAEHPVHPRLIKLLYRVADRFRARQINVISGFRESTQLKAEGNHSRGRAVDFMVPGVKLASVVYYTRTLGRVGVGYYPVSGFVHLDVRDGPSYYWVDRSGPGQPSCIRRILTKTAARFDRKWRPRHDEPRRHKNRKGELLGAIEKADEEQEARTDNPLATK